MKLFPAILLVDDDEDFLFVARRALERSKLHAEILVARDGAEALRLLGLEPASGGPGSPFTVVAVLLDLRMPGTSGWDVLRRIRESERARSLPVVVVSSSNLPTAATSVPKSRPTSSITAEKMPTPSTGKRCGGCRFLGPAYAAQCPRSGRRHRS